MSCLGYLCFIVAAFSALRLAKFNIDTTQSHEFEGLPTPANALMLMSLAVLAETGKIALYQEHILIISVVAAFLLISPVRMFALKFKSFGIKGNELRYGFIVASLAMIICVPAYSVLAIIVLYIVISLLMHIVRSLKK
jgi:CDP-diacylglycerol--serine O-phosphatidyltransferase